MVTIDGGSSVRVFSVAASSFTVQNLTIANGKASGGTTIAQEGGGILNDGGTVTVTNSTFDHNSAVRWGGGGIINIAGGTATITNSTFDQNSPAPALAPLGLLGLGLLLIGAGGFSAQRRATRKLVKRHASE